ncbi:MAG: hypothetical protein HY770_05565 [Chitinivibrionia bacterium]|nr:hypothetical protein [Chitinivibrionia bacterium]
MSYQHKDLAAGRWKELPLFEQMAHIGGEVERALSWRAKRNAEYSLQAFERAQELIDLTMEWPRNPAHLREMARLREALVDYFYGTNEFKSTESSWKKYFSCFTYAARRNH